MREFFSANTAAAVYSLLLLIMSLILFTAMGVDKRRAKRQQFRIPEARLFLLALLGGGAGGWAGMYVFHHKTKHMKFVVLFPVIAAVQLAGLVYLAAAG